MDGPERFAGDAAPRLQVLRPDAACGVLQGRARAESGAGSTLRRESPGLDPAAPLFSALGEVTRCDLEPERHSRGHGGAEKSAHRPAGRGCTPAVQAGPRPARADFRVQAPHAGAFRGGYRVRADDYPPGGYGDALPPLQQGLRRRRRQPARSGRADLSHGLPVGRGAAAGQPARPAGALHPPADRREARRPGAQGQSRVDDLPTLPPASGGADAGRVSAHRRRGAQLPRRTLGRQRQEQHHRLADASARIAARRGQPARVR